MSKAWQGTILNTKYAPLFATIDEQFIRDKAKDEHYRELFPDLDELIEIIVNSSENSDENPDTKIKTKQLFRVLHHDFLQTENGMQQLIEKYNKNLLPKCPRVYCNGAKCFPVGVEREGNIYPKMLCPSCREIYNLPPPFHDLQNGEAFGTKYIDRFFEKYKDILPQRVEEVPYEPRIFGFRVKQHQVPIEPEKLEK